MTEITSKMKAHMALRKLSNNIENELMDLVSSTNVMGGDEFVAKGLLLSFQDSDHTNSFSELFSASLPAIIERLSTFDLRLQDTRTLLTFIQENNEPSAFRAENTITDAFTQGLLRSHPTLIQSFMSSLRASTVALSDEKEKDDLMAKQTTTERYMEAQESAYKSMTKLLEYCGELNIESSSEDFLKAIAKTYQTHPLSFI